MMKRIKGITYAVLFMVFVLVFSSIRLNMAMAAETSSKQYVTDDADIFTEKEEEKLEKLCKKASDACKTDIAIITMSQGMDGTVLDNYVRAIIESDYGYNPESSTPDAIVYVIDMQSRADRIITSGNAKVGNISQQQLDGIRETAENKLADGKYYTGCKKFINGVRKYMDTSITYKLTRYLPQEILISLGVAIVAVLVMMYHAKAKMTVNSNTYTKDHHFDVRRKEDHFINTTVVTRHIESHSSSGGGGGGGGGGGNSGSSGGHF